MKQKVITTIIFSILILTVSGVSRAETDQLSYHLLQGNWEQIIRDGESWAEREPENPSPHYFIQIAYYSLNRMDEANKSHRRISASPESAKTMRNIAENLILNNPDNPYAYILMEYVHFYAEEYEDMIIALNRALEIKPDYGPAYHDLAVAYSSLGNEEKALQLALEGINNAPDSLANYMYAGTVYRTRGNMSEAERILKKGIEKNRQAGEHTAYLHHQLSIKYIQSSEYDKAADILEDGIRISPDKEILYVLLGDAYARLGDFEKAAEAYSKAYKKADPGEKNLRNLIEIRKRSLGKQ